MFKLELYLTVWNLNINIIFQKCKLFSTQFRFLYTDKTSVTMDNLEDLLFCADKYKTDLLASLCRTSLVTFISSSLVCKVMRIAQCFSDSQIIDICLNFFFGVIAVANKRYETMSVQMKKRNWLKIRSLHSKDGSENWWFNFDRKTNTYFSLQNRLVGIYLPLTCMVTPKFDVKLPLKTEFSPIFLSDGIWNQHQYVISRFFLYALTGLV